MKRLPEVFQKNGYEHILLWRDSEYAITEARDTDTKKVYFMEAFEIQRHKEKAIGDKLIEARESTPSNEDWGLKGYTVYNMTDAQLKIGIMRSNKNSQKNKKV